MVRQIRECLNVCQNECASHANVVNILEREVFAGMAMARDKYRASQIA